MSATRTIALTIAAMLLAAGCGAGAPTTELRTNASAATSPAPASSAPTTEAVPQPADPAIGVAQSSGSDGTAAALEWAQPVAPDGPQPVDAGYPDGYVWAGLDVEVCVPTTPEPDGQGGFYTGYYINNTPWSLVMPDNSLVQASSTGYSNFPQPEYPWGDTDVAFGQCVRGWITFAVPADQAPTAVQYRGGSVVGPPLRWTV